MIQALGRTAFKSLEFLPSSLICPLCEASQAAGTIKALGIAIEMWAKLNQSAKVGPSQQPSAVLPLEVSTFGSARLRQLFEFLPSGLLLSFCEASQAGGIHRDLGMGTRAWAGLDHSASDPFQQLRCCLGRKHLWVQVAPYLPNWMQRRIAPMAWLVQQAPRA